MLISKKLTIDLVNQSPLRSIHAVQCDCNTRAVEVMLTAKGAQWKPPEGTAVSVAFRKPDGNKGWYDQLPDGSSACRVTGNVVTAILAPEMLTAPGRVDAAIVFQDADLNQLSTFSFIVEVAPNPAAGGVISNSYYKYSTMADVNAAMELLDTTIAELERAKANGEFKGEKGDKGDKGDPGEQGPQGIQGEKGEAPDAVLYTPQTLTPEQQAQARANIGALADIPKEISYSPSEPGYVKSSDGSIYTGTAGVFNTGYIYVVGYSKISASYRLANNGYAIAFYDGDKTLLAQSSIVGAGVNSQNNIDMDIPEDAVYCILSSYMGESQNYEAYITLKMQQKATYVPTKNGYVHGTTGDIKTNIGGAFNTGYISLIGYKKMFVSYRLPSYAFVIAFYDENKRIMKQSSINGAQVDAQNRAEYDVPNGAAFCIFSAYMNENRTYEAYITLYTQEDVDKFNPFLHMKKINALGDSITSTKYTTPTWWQIIENRTNALFNNHGVSGSRIAVCSDKTDSFVERMDDMETDADAVIVMGGTNDNPTPKGTWNSTDTTTFFGALNVLLSTLCVNFVGKPIFVCTPIQTADGSQYNVGNPATALAEKAETDTISLQLRAEAIKQKCAQYGIHCIDLFNGSGINGLDADRVYYRTDDTLHPSSVGQNRLANIIQPELEKFFA